MKLPLVIVAGWSSRVAVVLFSLLNTRLLLDMLGTEGYASFVILLSLAPWFALLNFGIPSAAQNAIAKLRSEDIASDRIRRTVVNTATVATAVAIPLAYILAFVLRYTVIKQFTSATTAGVFFVCVALSVNSLLTFFNQVLYALHRGIFPNTMPALQAGATALLLYFTKTFSQVNFTSAAFAYTLPNLLIFLVTGHAAGAFRTLTIEKKILIELKKSSQGFFLFSLISTAALSLDYLIMSQILSSSEIVQYSLANRLFSVFLSVHAVLLSSTWSSMSDAFFSGQLGAMRRKLLHTLAIGLVVAGLPAAGLLYWHAPVVSLIGGANAPLLSTGLVFTAWLYLLIRIWSDTFAMTQMSCNQMTTMNFYVLAQTACSIAGQWWLGRQFGPTGVMAGLTFSFVITAAWILPWKFISMTRPAAVR